MRFPPRLRSAFPVSLAAVAVAVALIAGCGREANSPMAPGSGSTAASRVAVQGLATAVRPDIAAAIGIQNRITPDLLRHTGIIGSGTSVDEQGRAVIVVYT